MNTQLNRRRHRDVLGQRLGLCFVLTMSFVLDLKSKAEELKEPSISQADREHWSFRPLVRPAVPALQTGDAANPIDVFLERRLRESGLVALGRGTRSRCCGG